MLRRLDGEVRFDLDGVKARGFELGETAFRARLEDGVVKGELGRLSLYGGALIGLFSLDASGPDAALQARLAIDSVDLDRIYDTGNVDALARGTLN